MEVSRASERIIEEKNVYRHFKGGLYEVVGVAKDTETEQDVVVYKALKDGRLWVRPLSMFLEEVPEGSENPTDQKYRFELHGTVSLDSMYIRKSLL